MNTFRTIVLSAAAAALLGVSPAAHAATGSDAFYKAYYHDVGQGDAVAAVKLYEKALSGDLDGKLRDEASRRLESCREDVASADLAALMPPDTFAYVELGPIGTQVKSLLRQLGILREGGVVKSGRQVAISSVLVDELLGMRGAAIALNKIDPQRGEPGGVIVLHPGKVDVVRGLIESALPAGGHPEEAIGGFPTYRIEDELYVTITRRLIIASPDASNIEDVIARMTGGKRDSLAGNKALEAIEHSRGKALISFFVDTTPIMPMIEQIIAHEARNDQDLAMANALLDIKSFRSVSGHFGFDDSGLSALVELRLDADHRNLVYNLLRTHPVEQETLHSVPSGVAAFAVAGLNGLGSRFPSSNTDENPRIVTGLDFGREIFANIAGLALFAMPPEGGSHGGIPDIGAAITVNDPAKSRALWEQVLGLGCLAAGAPTPEGRGYEINGTEVHAYRIDDQFELRFASHGNTILVTTTDSGMKRCLATQNDGASVVDDAIFAPALKRLSRDTTKAILAHPARCIELARPFMGRDYQDVAPFVPMMKDTVASMMVSHSDQRLGISMNVTGVPEIGDLLSELIATEMERERTHTAMRSAMAQSNWQEALAQADHLAGKEPDSARHIKTKFDILVAAGKHEDARRTAHQYIELIGNNANGLNNFAWGLLTEDKYGEKFDALALKCSERSNELANENWAYLDTLALAMFRNGRPKEAVTVQRKAIEIAGDRANDQLHAALKRFEDAAQGG